MQSDLETVPAFLKSLPEDRRKALTGLRRVIRAVAPELRESMRYGMPTYEDAAGEPLIAFNSQRQYMALYICRPGVLKAHRAELKGLSCGKGCVRFRRMEQLPIEVAESLVRGSLRRVMVKKAR